MKKKELVERVAEQANIAKPKVKAVLDLAFDAISQEIASGESVIIQGFGKFTCKEKPAKTKTNSETGETIEVPASKVVNFRIIKPSKDEDTEEAAS